ncbi:DUF4097 family beta strand repeat protein [Kineosporia sp. J2-2]|uniref:DUF4097 family beta strand repeat protein n=1 Tax=Kineosporia corallincola TaxID=2835133 RepID=A0ABS5TLV8_9ACTN|nr:DUF4097 family beta strand repeat-containing protein [Kineosporia corallincola]MBT0772080.1 DUF4097 family beta strand repeat protein [Kineosporia corallincola]
MTVTMPPPARPASRWLTPVRATTAVLGLSLVGLGVATVVTQFATRVTDETLVVSDPVSSLTVDVSAGDVTVRTGPAGGPVTVRVHSRAAVREAGWTRTMDDGNLGLTGRCEGGWPIDSCSVAFDVLVPADQAGDLTVDLRTGSGDQTLSGLAGPATLRTGAGDVRVTGFTGPTLKVTTGSGDIRAGRLESGGAELRTGTGDIDAEFTAATTGVSARTGTGDVTAWFTVAPVAVDTRADTGDVRLFVPEDGTHYDVTGASRTGDRRIEVPTGSSTHRLGADTGSGDVTVKFR